MKKTAYVTGSSGFLGLNLCEELLRQGWRVLALHRATSDTRYLRGFAVEPVVGDINDPVSLARTLPLRVDALFHVAGSTSLWSRHDAEQDRINIDGTRNVVEAALAAGARRFVHTSSISAWGMRTGTIDETAEQLGAASPVNYQRSKCAAEAEVRKGVARGLEAVITVGEFGSVFTGKQPRLTREAAAMATTSLYCDCAKAQSELGFRAVPLRSMVEDCYRWMKAEGELDTM